MLIIDCGARKIEVNGENMYIVESNKKTPLKNINQLTDDEAERLYKVTVILDEADEDTDDGTTVVIT